ncbi:MAG: ABC transporter permease [Chloroflexi bacterium]|nr:ABC transporter permease [Chloroflexota bacterium]MCC6893162.1 ABC transporter permease [Anaerolineae bacterium]
MAQYITRRVLLAVLVVIGVTLLTFISIHLSGDPAVLYVSERAGQEELAEARRRLGLDKPLPEQYLNFLSGLARGDLGLSLANRTPALALVIERLPATLELTLGALLLSNIIAIPIGLISAVKRGTRLDGTIMLVAMFGQSMPGFWLGIMSILFFGVTLRAFPVSGQVPVLAPLLAGDINTALQNLPAGIHHAILPVVTISVFSIARNARLVRSALLEVLGQEYVTTARAKGLSERQVILRHALRNAMIPIVTIVALEFGFLLSGVIVTESVFAWPGVGRLVFNAIGQRDIPVVQAAVVFFAFVFVGLNLVVDILYAYLDPRIRLK